MSQHVVIVGGGVIGLCSAWYCTQRGDQVTVIDRAAPERDGCSFGNAGMIVPSHMVPLAAPGMVALGLKWMGNPESPFYVRPRLSWDLLSWGYQFWRACTPQHVQRAAPLLRDLNLASRELYVELDDAWNHEFGLTRKGLLMLCRTQAALDEEAHGAERAKTLGVPAEVLDRGGVATLDPQVSMDVMGGVWFPQDCHLSPQRFMSGLQQRLTAAGCEFLWNREVQGLPSSGTRLQGVDTNRGFVAADQVVLAGGSWSSGMAQALRLPLPMQPGKGYSLTLEGPRKLPNLCSIGVEGRIAVTPMGERLRVGGTMELSGLNERVEPRRVQGIVKSFCRYFPEFTPDDFANLQPWRGLRPCTPDGLPYLGRTRRSENLVIATGHAMMGLSLGPITGQLVSQLVARETPSIDLTLLSPDRY